MDLIPNIPQTLIHIKKLEEGPDDLIHSARLFWLFVVGVLNPEEFRLHIFQENEKIVAAKPTGGRYIDTEIESFIEQGANNPEKVAQILVNRLDAITSKKQIQLSSSDKTNPTALFLFTHIESARLARLLKAEGYSEDLRILLQKLIDSFLKCDSILRSGSPKDWPKYLTASLRGVGSFLLATEFEIQKADGKYEDALTSFFKAVEITLQARLLSFDDAYMIPTSKLTPEGKIPDNEQLLFEFKTAVRKAVQPSFTSNSAPGLAPWIMKLTPQSAADCVEQLKLIGRVHDPKTLASNCRKLIEFCRENPLGIWDKVGAIKDSDGLEWEPTIYWYNALGWIDAQLNPSELLELLQLTEQNASEKRLLNYFFSPKLWDLIPARVKGSLINADRILFNGPGARDEAALNEIKIAVEEFLFIGLWKPLIQWIQNKPGRKLAGKSFVDLVDSLEKRNRSPGLVEFEIMLKFPITLDYLGTRRIDLNERNWISKDLPVEVEKL